MASRARDISKDARGYDSFVFFQSSKHTLPRACGIYERLLAVAAEVKAKRRVKDNVPV